MLQPRSSLGLRSIHKAEARVVRPRLSVAFLQPAPEPASWAIKRGSGPPCTLEHGLASPLRTRAQPRAGSRPDLPRPRALERSLVRTQNPTSLFVRALEPKASRARTLSQVPVCTRTSPKGGVLDRPIRLLNGLQPPFFPTTIQFPST